jgi:signal transduction histidine kinase
MRRRIALLVAATTSAVVLAFVIPLCLLVRSMAQDRALATGNDEARSAAIVVSGLHDSPQLRRLVEQVDGRSPARTTVVAPDETTYGDPGVGLRLDDDIERAREGEAFSDVDDRGGEIVIPVDTPDGVFVVVTTVSPDLLKAGVYRAWASIAVLGLVLLAAALFVADRLGRRVSEPLTQLADVAERLGDGDLDARAELQGPPETVELAGTMNRMADRIEELLLAEREAVGDLSHRLRTPVTALRLDAESLADPELGERLGRHIEQLQTSIDTIVHDARRPLRDGLGAACDARAVVADRTEYWSALAEDQGRQVRLTLPAHAVPCGVDASDLTDVVDVLVDNVFAHTSEEAGFAVTLEEQDGQVVLEVADDGPPLVVALDAERPGTSGLGLHIVRRTAARAGGHFTWQHDGTGTVARVTLPAASD